MDNSAVPKEVTAEDVVDADESSSTTSTQQHPSNASPSSSYPLQAKRRRSDHNEIERRRREVQRDRIDELRMVLPGSSSVSRLSTVNIVIRAKEYIEGLRNRVAELEAILAHYHPEHMKIQQQHQHAMMGSRPMGASKPLAPKNTAESSWMPQGSFPPPGGYYPQPSATSATAATAASAYHPSHKQHQQQQHQPISKKPTLSRTEEEILKRKILDYFRSQRPSVVAASLQLKPQPQQQQQQQQPQLNTQSASPPLHPGQEDGLLAIAEAVTTASEASSKRDSDESRNTYSDAELRNEFSNRRHSSLLFSSGNGVFWNKRDSSHSTPGLGSMFPVEESLHMDIRCGKCQRGIDNLIMIDCEKCKTWYHLRCVNVAPEAIPLTWKCAEC